jgi:hypothetical protein
MKLGGYVGHGCGQAWLPNTNPRHTRSAWITQTVDTTLFLEKSQWEDLCQAWKMFAFTKTAIFISTWHFLAICLNYIVKKPLGVGGFPPHFKFWRSRVYNFIVNFCSALTYIVGITTCISRVPITVAAPSKAWTVFARSNAGIVGSNLTQGMDVCVRLFCVCAVLCVGSGLTTGWSLVQGVLPTVYRFKKLKKRPRFIKRTVEP